MSFGVDGSFFDEFVALVKASYDDDANSPDVQPASWQTGALKSKGRSSLPLVHWSRPSGQLEDAAIVGRRDYTSTDGGSYWFSAIYDDLAQVECRIVANGWAELDALQSGIVRAARNALGKVSQPGGYQHVTETDEMPIALGGHQMLVQSFTWRYPLIHEWGKLTVISGADSVQGTTEQQNEDGSSQTPGPTISQP